MANGKSSFKALVALLVALLASSFAHSQPGGYSASCPNAQLSCHNTSAVDTCCLNYPGGQMLQTQFWDTNPSVGPPDSWTVHGLWPDLCDGTYEANCDRSRAYANVSAIINAAGEEELLLYMQKYWKDYRGDDPNLWRHEWSKHGTCVSTLDTKCYTDYKPQQEVVDYFRATIALFKTLSTYETLAAAGVLPSSSRTWTEEEIQTPLKKMHGAAVTLGCRGTELTEVWYHFSVRGSVQTGDFVATEPDGDRSRCPGTGIRYLPKSSPGRSSSTIIPTVSRPITPIPSPTSTAPPFTGRGFLQVHVKGESSPSGCLISQGTWYMSGTCAGFRVQDDVAENNLVVNGRETESRVFTLTSSKGPCGVVKEKLVCAKTLPIQTIFSTTSNGTLSYHEYTSFYAHEMPRKFRKEVISTVEQGGDDEVEIELVWSSEKELFWSNEIEL